MSLDPLQYLPVDKWGELQNVFKTDWPRGVSGYAVVEAQRNLIGQGFDNGFKVYCPYGDVWNGMVAINEKDQFYEVIVLCPQDDTKKLQDALTRTNVINWKRFIIIPFAPQNVIDCLQKTFKDIKIDVLYTETYILNNTVFDDIRLPSNITFDLISSEHLDLVDSTWFLRYKTSAWYFQKLINIKRGYGLFRDNNLVSWVFFSESGTLLHLYTVEKERKKGYGELLLKLVSNILNSISMPTIAYCLKDNENACNLYTKLGFVKTEPVAWCYINKK